MIYSQEDVEAELVRYFQEDVAGNNEDIISIMLQEVKHILKNTNVLNTCHYIRDNIINLPEEDNKHLIYRDKKFLPMWVRMLVYVVIYQYLENNAKPAYSQKRLLEEMGLYADIFGKKNWCMYSPDMKFRQSKYEPVHLPLNHAEVESNEIFRGMIHHMICYSTILTDTFVDMFGKLGLIPALCARGYVSSQTWLNLDKYKELLIFQLALEKQHKVSECLKELQKKINNKVVTTSEMIDKAVRSEFLIKKLSKEQLYSIIRDKSVCEFDIYNFAAYFMIQQYFAPQYWLDSKLLEKVNENNKLVLTSELKDNLTKYQINEFIDTDFSEGIKILADSYKAKRFQTEYIDYKEAINYIFLETLDDTDLLYLDVPKYLREEKRFDFDIEWYHELFSALSRYCGDWILTWKNYVEISNERKALKESVYSSVHTQNGIIPMEEEYWIEDISNETPENKMEELYKELSKISELRQLYVFSYRSENRNVPNSIIFITTINFSEIDNKDFCKKYKVNFLNNGRLTKLKYEDFYTNVKKWFRKEKQKGSTK